MGPDDRAIDHLHTVRHRFAVVQDLKDHLPKPCQRPTPELPIDRAPLAKLLREVTPRRSCSGDPEHAIQYKTMIRRLASVRLSDCTDERFEECPFCVRHQVARQDSLPSESYLESRQGFTVNPFCQHDLREDWRGLKYPDGTVETTKVEVTTLDNLIAEHGAPAFVKIDVEGYEVEVLMGLTSYVPALTFEFSASESDRLRSCLQLLNRCPNIQVNLIEMNDRDFILPEWLSIDEFNAWADTSTLPDIGDIFVWMGR